MWGIDWEEDAVDDTAALGVEEVSVLLSSLLLPLYPHTFLSIDPLLTDPSQAAWRDGHRAASSFAPTSPTSNNVDQEQTRALAAVRAVYSRLVRALRAKVVFPPGVEGGGWMKDQVDRFKT